METIAVYWEPKIKTYGIYAVTDLILIEVPLEMDQLDKWEGCFRRLEVLKKQFSLVFLQRWNEREMRFYIVCHPGNEDQMLGILNAEIPGNIGDALHSAVPVELVHFQGPHFNERFGIADFTLKTLNEAGIRILAAAFSGSVIYLVLPEGKAHQTKSLLNRHFEVPQKPAFS